MRAFRRTWSIAAASLLLASTPALAWVESTFDNGLDGWVAVDLPWPDPGAPPQALNTYVPDYEASGGNPGGYISLQDPSAGPVFYWRAPADFLGDRGDAYGQQLRFDLASSGSMTLVEQEDVVLVGAGLTLVYHLPSYPLPTFTTYSIPLDETGWRHDNDVGAAASAADMQAVLSALEALYIRGEYLDGGNETGYLDNVVLESELPNDIIFVSGFEY